MKKIEDVLQKYITPKNLSWFLMIGYWVSLIPVFAIGIYNYPSADDYSIGSSCRQVWVESHSIIQTVWQGILRAVEDWMIWMGYFTSNFVMAIPPSVFGEKFYILTTVIMVGAVSLSTGYLLHQIFVNVFHADKYISRCIIAVLLFFNIQCMIGRNEAFYWYCGASNYILTHAMSIFFYGMLISLAVKQKENRKMFVFGTACIGFMTGGANQMTALNVAIVLAVAAGWVTWQKKWNSNKRLIIPMLSFYIGFVLNIAAPGNWIRAEGTSGMNPIKAVLVSLSYCLEYCLGEWTDWSMIVMIIMLIPLFWRLVSNTSFSFSYPLVVIAFGYGLVSAMMTPPLFAVGNIGAQRLQALTFTMYILVLVLCEGYVIGWIQKKYYRKMENADSKKLSLDTIFCVTGCILFLLFGMAITIVPNPHYYTFSSAMTDLLNGSAKAYGEALEERAVLYNSGEKNIVVEPLPAQPVLLYFSDITSDAQDWQNRGLCRYYGLDSVVVKE